MQNYRLISLNLLKINSKIWNISISNVLERKLKDNQISVNKMNIRIIKYSNLTNNIPKINSKKIIYSNNNLII